jgi:hypothetical protein
MRTSGLQWLFAAKKTHKAESVSTQLLEEVVEVIGLKIVVVSLPVVEGGVTDGLRVDAAIELRAVGGIVGGGVMRRIEVDPLVGGGVMVILVVSVKAEVLVVTVVKVIGLIVVVVGADVVIGLIVLVVVVAAVVVVIELHVVQL